MLCDSHIHYIPQAISENTTFYKGVWTDRLKLFDFLEAAKIDKALLVYPSTDAQTKLGEARACQIYNQEIAKILKENSKIVGSALVDLSKPATLAAQVNEIKAGEFKAISIASSEGGKFNIEGLLPLFEAVEKEKLHIFVHPQTINPIGFERVQDPLLMPVLEYSFDNSMFMGLLMMEGILEKLDIKFIFSSLGGVMPFLKERFDRVYAMLRQRQIVKDLGKLPSQILNKVYVDTSGASLAHIRLAIEMFGEDHILWGSDYPVAGNVEENLAMLDHLGVGIKKKITHLNFEALFGS